MHSQFFYGLLSRYLIIGQTHGKVPNINDGTPYLTRKWILYTHRSACWLVSHGCPFLRLGREGYDLSKEK
jgi:hypothetical protein